MDSITAKPKTITLTVETTLSPAGMRAHAQMLIDVAKTLDSVAHAITLRDTARAWKAQAKAVERSDDPLAELSPAMRVAVDGVIDAHEDRVIAEYCADTGATLRLKRRH